MTKFCDLKCRHAAWPENEAVDGSGSCRTFAALYCGLKKRLVHKNSPCRDKDESAPGAAIKAPT